MTHPTRREVLAALDLFRQPGAPPASQVIGREPSYARVRARMVADAQTTAARLEVLATTDGAFVVLVQALASSMIGQDVAALPGIEDRRAALACVPEPMLRQTMDHVRRVFAARRASALRVSDGADTPCAKGQSEPGLPPRPSGGAR